MSKNTEVPEGEDTLATLSKNVLDLRRSVERRTFFVILGSCIVVLFLVGVSISLWGNYKTNNRQDKTDDRISATQQQLVTVVAQLKAIQDQQAADTQDRILSSCNHDNDFKVVHNKGFQDLIDTFTLIFSQTQSEATRTFASQQIEKFTTDLVPLRDCTPAGIAEYYKQGGH